MDTQRLQYLFRQHDNSSITDDEKGELYSFIADFSNKEEVLDYFDASINNTESVEQDRSRWSPIIQKILSTPQVHKEVPVPFDPSTKLRTGPAEGKLRMFPFRRVAAAAIIFLLLSVGGYFILRNEGSNQIATTETKLKNDAVPGGNKAILTLADGTQIVLDSATNGTLSQQGNTKIIKLNDGELAYNGTSANGEILYNTISTPKGGQYQIVLADGSKVWLNAASSLRFPASFTGKERNVELTGEGYFEVAHNASKPFNVSANGMNVQVLGTHFNINAYNDEASIKTTLLEGSVRVISSAGGGAQRAEVDIKPGQQAQLEKNSSSIRVIRDIDVDQVVAWKNGLFNFADADLQAVLRQLARWYDVEVVYEGTLPRRNFEGEIQRNLNLSKVLKILEKNKVNFRIEGKKLFVSP